jgi:hypothetical protein
MVMLLPFQGLAAQKPDWRSVIDVAVGERLGTWIQHVDACSCFVWGRLTAARSAAQDPRINGLGQMSN